MGNGMEINATHNPATGELTFRSDFSFASGYTAQSMEYVWDQMHRLRQRSDLSAGLNYEYFTYDQRDRLREVRWNQSGTSQPGVAPPDAVLTQRLNYDISGNILCKLDVGPTIDDCSFGGGAANNYHYERTGFAGPHAVTRLNTNSGSRHLTYDANGNVEIERFHSIDGTIARDLSYTAHNLLKRVETNGQVSVFHYGADQQRFIRTDSPR